MAYPQTPILTAFIAALSTPPLVANSIPYDVFTTVQRGQDRYVLLSQPTLTSGSGSSDCEAWDATLLLSVFTKYQLNARVNFEQTLAIGTELAERLVQQRLPLDGFDMSPIELALAETRQTSNEATTTVQHTLRLRFEVYESSTRIFDKPLATYTPAEILTGYPRLSELGPLNCPVIPVKTIGEFTPAEVATYPRLNELGPLNCPVVPDRHVLEMSFTAATGDAGTVTATTATAGGYTGYAVTGGAVEVVLHDGGTDYFLTSAQAFTLKLSDTLTVTRTSGNPTITFAGA